MAVKQVGALEELVLSRTHVRTIRWRSCREVLSSEFHDRGSISILTIGLFFVTVSTLFLVTDIASIIVAKRSLVHVTEAAAMRATHQLDLGAYYQGTKATTIPIDCASAFSRIKDELSEWISAPSQLRREELHRVEIVGFSCEGNRILLTTSARATLPFRLPGSALPNVEIHSTVAAESNRSQ